MRSDPPAAPAVRAILSRILSSEAFKRSERARTLLAYLVEREQAGDSERLKGYAIAVDVFGKDEAFDSSTDAVVRVQAGRLRELLAQYYETEGRQEPVRIVIPRGSYVPTYEAWPPAARQEPAAVAAGAAGDAGSAGPEAVAVRGPSRRAAPVASRWRLDQARLLKTVLAVAVVLVAVLAYRTAMQDAPALRDAVPADSRQRAPQPAAELASALPTIRVVTQGDDGRGGRVASVLRAALARFDTVELIGGEYSTIDETFSPEATGFVLSVAPGATKETLLVELQNLRTGVVLLNRSFPVSDGEIAGLDEAVANIATVVAPVNGVIYGYLEQRRLLSGTTNCLVLNEAFFTDPSQARHGAAYRCLEGLVDAGAQTSIIYSELAALNIEARRNRYDYPPDQSDEAAMRLARLALQNGPASPYAYRTMGYLYSRKGDSAEAIRWMRKAYELNTFDLSMAAAYGYALVFAGSYSDGAAILQRAVDSASAHPSWWDYSLFLARFMLDDMDGASRATDALLTPKRSHYLAARLIVAHSQGDEQRADALATELIGAYPNFVEDPGRSFRKANYPSDLTIKFVEALKGAGIGGAS